MKDFEEHKKVKDYDVTILKKTLKEKLKYQKVIQGMKLEIIGVKDKVADKRHSQRLEAMKQDFEYKIRGKVIK